MSENWKRTHHNDALNETHIGKEVVLNGWVASLRDHGGLIFADLRDRWGITQIVFIPEENPSLADKAKSLKMESVVGVRGSTISPLVLLKYSFACTEWSGDTIRTAFCNGEERIDDTDFGHQRIHRHHFFFISRNGDLYRPVKSHG